MSAIAAIPSAQRHGADAAGAASAGALAGLRNFHALDLLRGLGALTVVMFHAAFVYGIPAPAEGQIVVDMFFVMSGFIVACRYERDLEAGMSFATFAKIRLIRLYPLFLLGTILGLIPAVVTVAAGQGDAFYRGLIKSFPLAVFMLPSHFAQPRIDEIYPLNYVAWSLALELVVNLAYAATFRIWTRRNILVLLGIAFVGLIVCAIRYGALIGGFDWANAPVGPARAVFGFAAGLLLYRLYRSTLLVPRVPWWSLVAIVLLIAFVAPPVARPIWELFLISVVSPLVVAAAIASEPPKALHGVCAVAGIYSYVIYSLHAPLIGFFLRGEVRLHLDSHVQTPTSALAFTLLVGVVSFVAHHVYDRPIRRLLSKGLLARSPASSAPTPLYPAAKY